MYEEVHWKKMEQQKKDEEEKKYVKKMKKKKKHLRAEENSIHTQTNRINETYILTAAHIHTCTYNIQNIPTYRKHDNNLR